MRLDAPSPRITDESLEKAVDWLRDNAVTIGRAKQRTVQADHMVKHIEALQFKLSDAKSADARRADARASEAYVHAITEDAAAAGAYEELKSLREAAALKIEVWRSEQANFRSMKI